MKYIKINNFLNEFDQPDYKGLDLNKVIPGSQIYSQDLSYAVLATEEEFVTLPTDTNELTQEQYLQEKGSVKNQNQQPNQQEILIKTVALLSTNSATQAQQIQTLVQTVNDLNTVVTQLKGGTN
jgi:cyclophilin family peptidyl-prolyl cis-trans isomerase